MYKNILIPIALDHDHDDAEWMETAHALAAPEGRITLLHVVERAPEFIAQQLPSDVISGRRAEAEAELAAIGARLARETETLVQQGEPGRVILDLAQKMGADCVVIASHKPGLQDYLLGSTAARVVRHAACAVHVLR